MFQDRPHQHVSRQSTATRFSVKHLRDVKKKHFPPSYPPVWGRIRPLPSYLHPFLEPNSNVLNPRSVSPAERALRGCRNLIETGRETVKVVSPILKPRG
ncbi:hypothetical protein RRG08_011452 [Elysia crispata]|uniref:Uncharacterized protein n=1 Tax=Elysia crispata TaxID=231223 RepID=A0AAE1DMB8_9GAST|nr:hypothetical protein RRG08_011452 [Elysia crispata]